MKGSRIFVSYRRQDSPGFAGRIADHLDRHFGGDAIFRDVEAIEYGTDFIEAIDAAVASCAVVVVVIGPLWVNVTDSEGRIRLYNADDFVRLEVGKALARGIRVIPVLVQNALPPRAEDLPSDLVQLSRRQAIAVSDERFSDDMARLIRAIESAYNSLAPRTFLASSIPGSRGAARRRRSTLIGAAVAVVALGAAVLAFTQSPNLVPVLFATNGNPRSPGPSLAAAPQAARAPIAETARPLESAVVAPQAPPAKQKPERLAPPRPAAASQPRAPAPRAEQPASPPAVAVVATNPPSTVAGDRGPINSVAAPAPVVASEPTPAPSKLSLVGTWEGPWNDAPNRQHGRLYFRILENGAVTGWMSNLVAKRSFRMRGTLNANGKLELGCDCSAEEHFTARGSVQGNEVGKMKGSLVLAASAIFGRSDFALNQVSP
jgi:hypothetical protein